MTTTEIDRLIWREAKKRDRSRHQDARRLYNKLYMRRYRSRKATPELRQAA